MNNEHESIILRYQEAIGQSLFAIDQETARKSSSVESALRNLKQVFQKKQRILVNQYSDSWLSNKLQVDNLCRNILASENSLTDAAEFICLGSLRVDAKNTFYSDEGSNSVPLVLPLLGHNNFLVTSSSETIQKISLQIIVEAMKGTAPGQLQVVVYNPSLSSALAPLSPYQDTNLIKIITDEYLLEKEFAFLTQEIIQADSQLKGQYKNILELRRHVRQPVGRLCVFAIMEIGSQLNQANYRKLLDLLRQAPHTGTSFLLFHDEAFTYPEWIHHQELAVQCLTLKADANALRYENRLVIPKFSSLQDVEQVLSELVSRASQQAAITLPFHTLERLDTDLKESSAKGLLFFLGLSGLNRISIKLGEEITQIHNVLISGAAGQGKSNLLEVIINSLCLRYPPDELELYLLDFKDGITFSPYSNIRSPEYLPHAKVIGIESDRDFGLAVLHHLEQERQQRASVLTRAGVPSIERLHAMNPQAHMPRIVAIIDEYQKIMDEMDDIALEAADLLENLVRQGRACGIHFILSSQSIQGIAALLSHEDQVYGQFPARIALKNSLNESYAVLGQGNDGAARLRVRGEAVLNINYGDPASNLRFTVAYANPDELHAIRKRWWLKHQSNHPPPTIFQKGESSFACQIIDDLVNWRRTVLNQTDILRIPLGTLLSVRRDVISVPFANEAGRNLAILGAGEGKVQNQDESGGNYAIGVLQTISLALALQHPKGNARFLMFNGLDDNTLTRNGHALWLEMMQRFGFPVEIVQKKDVGPALLEIARQLSSLNEQEENYYLLGFGLDRCASLMYRDPLSGISGTDALQELLKTGSMQGIHLLSWWGNISSYNNQIGYGNEGFLETKLILRLDEGATQSILGPFVKWGVKSNRGLLHDQTQLERNLTILPFSPLNARDKRSFEAAVWE